MLDYGASVEWLICKTANRWGGESRRPSEGGGGKMPRYAKIKAEAEVAVLKL
jgi:hypothetical protein